MPIAVRLVADLGRLILALTFGWAAAMKMRDQAAARRTMGAFGLSARLAASAAAILPFVELATGAALLLAASARIGAVASLALLLMFMAAMVWSLANGRTPNCNCFGQLGARPIGWRTVTRNAGLAVLAVGVMATPPETAASAIARLTQATGVSALAVVVGAAMLAVLAFQTFVAFELLRQHGRILVRLDAVERASGSVSVPTRPAERVPAGLPNGARAPSFVLPSATGAQVGLRSLLDRGKPLIIVFSDPGCHSCVEMLGDVSAWQRDLADRLTIAVISRKSTDEAPTAYGSLRDLLFQNEHEVSELYGIYGTPAATLVQPGGAVAARPAFGRAAIDSLVAQLAAPALIAQSRSGAA